MNNILPKILYHGIYITGKKPREDGGESCATEMSFNFKAFIYLFMIIFELFVLIKY